MKRLALICLLFVSPLLALLTQAQSTFPTEDGERVKYHAYIETPRAYISGICILLKEGDLIKGSLFNEFGIVT